MPNFKSIMDSLKGISGGAGDLLRQYANMVPSNTNYVVDPGDFLRKRSDGSRIPITAPIAYDVWYLYSTANILPMDSQDANYQYVDDNLYFINANLEGMSILRSVQSRSDILSIITGVKGGWYGEEKSAYQNLSYYWIQALAYEFGYMDQGYEYESDGPDDAIWENLCGAYVTFPIGQLGVMEVVSLFFETDIEGDDFSLQEDEIPFTFGKGDGSLFPPATDSGQNNCYGLYLIESGYKLNTEDETNRYTELFASPMPETVYQKSDKKAWLRFWFDKNEQRPVPGEFIGILTKPYGLPPHAWWFQESSPFVYAGNWWETEWVTSGWITGVTLEADRTDGGIGDQYLIRVHGCEIKLYTTDFFKYNVDERVAIVKVGNVEDSLPDIPFNWEIMRTQWDKEKGNTYTDYMIMPISFYEG